MYLYLCVCGITDAILYSIIVGLLPNRVSPVQTFIAVCAGHGAGGHAAAFSVVSVCTFCS